MPDTFSLSETNGAMLVLPISVPDGRSSGHAIRSPYIADISRPPITIVTAIGLE